MEIKTGEGIENLTKEEIGNILNEMASAFMSESDNENIEWVEKTIREHDFLDIENPEHFSLLVSISLESKLDLMTRIALSNVKMSPEEMLKISPETMYKMSFVYARYRFIEKHLESILIDKEGVPCSADKTRWLINKYVHYLISGEIPSVEKRSYYHPKMTEISRWIEWIDTMQELYNGQIQKYLEAKMNVLKNYEEMEAVQDE